MCPERSHCLWGPSGAYAGLMTDHNIINESTMKEVSLWIS
ncbi:hypothetical protein CJ97_gp51 [Ralstonia phage RSB2]|uniref:Uncharacterized protein ORF51 n=1 Tax=Ralstonia phage RSB2 TaxID=913183 RepID=E5RV31_9CAUD|nr:hypothetical protein CJ97_gp51 [Ralstonia phage RSB2]BAJ51839.1 hypothetical protein [Ralstonia phage RSB2]